MSSEKIASLQSSLDYLKQKMKSFDFYRSNAESRMNNIQAKYAVLTSSTSKAEKENFSHFDSLLSQSHVFTSSLKKVDANATVNIKKLEEYFTDIIQEQHSKFSQIEERMLSMFSQKEKILRNVALEMENYGHSIKAIQEWIKTDHNRGNSFSVMEENLKQRLDMVQKNNQMKLDIIDEKIKYFEHLQESASSNRKKNAQEKEIIDQQIKSLKKDLRRRMEELQERIMDERRKKFDAIEQKMAEFPNKIEQNRQNIQQIEMKLTELKENIDKNEKKMKDLIKENQTYSLEKEILGRETKPAIPRYNDYYQQQETINTPITQERTNRLKNQDQQYSKPQKNKNTDFSEKKPLPPKKNLFAPDSPPELDMNPREMSGGIRGLLQKSKEKDREDLNRRSDVLSREKSASKGLPPVKEDPFAKKKKTQTHNKHKKKESQSEREEVVYQIDEQGYLMDQEGNYLLNENGEMIRLSPQEIQQYMEEGESY